MHRHMYMLFGLIYKLTHTHHTHTQVGFKMFLGVIPTVANWSAKGDEFSLILDQNPLVDFVELPEDHSDLLYSNIICGVLRGALEMVCTGIFSRPKYLCVGGKLKVEEGAGLSY